MHPDVGRPINDHPLEFLEHRVPPGSVVVNSDGFYGFVGISPDGGTLILTMHGEAFTWSQLYADVDTLRFAFIADE